MNKVKKRRENQKIEAHTHETFYKMTGVFLVNTKKNPLCKVSETPV